MTAEAAEPRPTLLVVQATEAFSQVWGDAAAAAGCDAAVLDSLEELSPAVDACALVLTVGGSEERAHEWLREAMERHPAPVAVVGAAADHRLSAALVRIGASDYFCLPHDLGALGSWIDEQADRVRGQARARSLAIEEQARYDFSGLIGESGELRTAIRRAGRVIPRGNATILVTGETGTGKELLAQAIHYNGPRAAQPFMEVNCTALPETLLEAELFGYEKGAFTDARASKPGLFEAADKGSLFLDEIGDLTLNVQAKLLKVLEEKQVRRLGSIKSRTVDVRVIAATHVDLAAAVGEGRFRADLYYRLNVLPIHLAPLREREGDVLLLAEHFLTRASEEYGVPRPALDAAARQAILAHAWPGNVRELKNAVERAVLLGDGKLHVEELLPAGAGPLRTGALPFPASLREIELAAARLAVERLEGNKSAAADLLGISRTRLYRLLSEGDDV